MTMTRPDDYEHYNRRVYAQVSGRLDDDIRAVMKAHDCDRSTAIRAILRVGLLHGGKELAEYIAKDERDRERRVRRGSSVGGIHGMQRRWGTKTTVEKP